MSFVKCFQITQFHGINLKMRLFFPQYFCGPQAIGKKQGLVITHKRIPTNPQCLFLPLSSLPCSRKKHKPDVCWLFIYVCSLLIIQGFPITNASLFHLSNIHPYDLFQSFFCHFETFASELLPLSSFSFTEFSPTNS